MSTGIMIVGLRGATGSTLAGTAQCANLEDNARFLLSEAPFAAGLGLPRPDALRWGGWDVIGPDDESWEQTMTRHGVIDPRHHPEVLECLQRVVEFPAAALGRDHAVATSETDAAAETGSALVARLRQDIRDFRDRTGVDQVILAYLATPAMLPPRAEWPETADDFIDMIDRGEFATAAPYYMAAAIEEGCGIIDYTASATLEMPGLVALAEKEGVALAGRDGSTGQTLLKSVLAETFATRRMEIRGWYSTNILGNHDGLVLQDPRYCDIKRIDKTALLDDIVGYQVPEHLVDIRYYRPAGDNKEAWDAIDLAGFFGCKGELRVNWRSSDSLLATPAIIDLCRFLSHDMARGARGIQSHLGVFFKYPLGTRERRYLHLARTLEAHCHAVDRSSDTAPDGLDTTPDTAPPALLEAAS